MEHGGRQRGVHVGLFEHVDEVGRLAGAAGVKGAKVRFVSADVTILDLEREVFVSLCGEEKTQARIEHMLMKGKPLRN